MGRCKDCRSFIVRCFRGDRCKRCARVTEEEKLEIAELEKRLIEEQLKTKREMQLTALEQSLLEEEEQRTAVVTQRETEMTLMEAMKLNEEREGDVIGTIGYLREWGCTCEQALEYVRLGFEGNNPASGEGWNETARYLQKCGLTSEQIEDCRNISMGVKRFPDNKGDVEDGTRHERIYDSVSNSVIGMADTEDTTRIDGDLKCNGSCVSDDSEPYGIQDCQSSGQGSFCQQVLQQLGKRSALNDGNLLSNQDALFGGVDKESKNGDKMISIDENINHSGVAVCAESDIIKGQVTECASDEKSPSEQDEIPIYESVTFGAQDDNGDGDGGLVIGTMWSIWDTTELQRMETIGQLQRWGVMCKVAGGAARDRQAKDGGTVDVPSDENSPYEVIAIGSTISDIERDTNGESSSHCKEKAGESEGTAGESEGTAGESEGTAGESKAVSGEKAIKEKVNEEKAIGEKTIEEKVVGEKAIEEKAINSLSKVNAAHEAHDSNATIEEKGTGGNNATTEEKGIDVEEKTMDGSSRQGRTVRNRRRKSIAYLRQWGFSCEEVLDYLRVTEGSGRASSNESLARVDRKNHSQVSVRTSSSEDLSEEKKRRDQIAMMEKMTSFARLRGCGFTAEQIFDYKWLSK